jgi:hypothetical protein
MRRILAQGTLDAFLRSILSRTQCAQRHLLRLGESFHSCDIEPFVRSVALQRMHMLTVFQVPECDGSVVTATGKRTTIGTHLERLHRSMMRLSRLHALPASHPPTALRETPRSSDKPAWVSPMEVCKVSMLAKDIVLFTIGEPLHTRAPFCVTHRSEANDGK